jgi:hypothetical protein
MAGNSLWNDQTDAEKVTVLSPEHLFSPSHILIFGFVDNSRILHLLTVFQFVKH